MMLKEMRKKSLKSNILTILICAAIGIFFLGMAFPGLKVLLSGKSDLDLLSADEIKPGMYVETTVYGIYDYYACTTETKNGSEKTISCEYIIPVGEAEYMGLLAPEKYLDDCDALMEESWDYLDGKTDEILGQIRVKGTITEMESESLKFYKEYLADYAGYDDLSAEEQAAFLPYYLKVDCVGDMKLAELIVSLLLAAVMLGVTIFIVIRIMKGGVQKGLIKYCKENGAQEKVEQFYRSTTPVNGLRIGREYILSDDGSIFLLSDTLVWAYMQVTNHKRGLITVSRDYAILLHTRKGGLYQHYVKSEAQTKEILDQINRVLPWVILGYSDEINKAYKKDRDSLIQACDRKRAETDFENGWVQGSYESGQDADVSGTSLE